VGCGELVHTTLTRCTGSDASAGTATASVLLGPFNSTGGYDWWQIYTREEPTYFDSAMTSLASFSLTLHDADATSPATALLGLPPIHMHHSSWNGALAVGGWTLQGDTECAGEVMGTPCYTHDLLSRGYGLPGNYSTLGFGGVYNDVRFRGADTAGQPVPTLRWYLNLTVTVVDPSVTLARELLSLTFRNFYPVRTGNWFQTVYVPAEAHSFVAMETRWPTSGRLLTDPSLSRFHGHQGSHLYSFLIASSVANLGMNQTKFLSSTGCEPVATSSAGFATSDDMISYLASQCPQCFALMEGTSAESSVTSDARLLCRANASEARVGLYYYDRASFLNCAGEAIDVKEGDPVTSITFYGPKPATPYVPDTVYGGTPSNEYAQHAFWFLKVLPTKGSLPSNIDSQLHGIGIGLPMVHVGSSVAESCANPFP